MVESQRGQGRCSGSGGGPPIWFGFVGRRSPDSDGICMVFCVAFLVFDKMQKSIREERKIEREKGDEMEKGK